MSTNASSAFWDRHEDEHCKFERLSPKNRGLAHSPDLIAMLILDRHFPSQCDMVCAAEHDAYYLKVHPNELFYGGVPEEDILDLMRCGLNYDSGLDSLYFFV